MASPVQDTAIVFVSRFNRVLAIGLWVIVAALLVAGLVDGTDWHRWLGLVPAAFGGLLGWYALWHPSVTVDDDQIVVGNVFHTVEIPWAALVHVDTRFALTLVTPARKVSAWAAPAPGRAGVAMARRNEQRHGGSGVVPVGPDGARQAGDLLHTESGDAAYLIRERWSELREAERFAVGVADETAVPVHVHWLTIVLLVVTAVGGWFAIAAQ